jgi:Macrocin-O-methyltransferase (TylF)
MARDDRDRAARYLPRCATSRGLPRYYLRPVVSPSPPSRALLRAAPTRVVPIEVRVGTDSDDMTTDSAAKSVTPRYNQLIPDEIVTPTRCGRLGTLASSTSRPTVGISSAMVQKHVGHWLAVSADARRCEWCAETMGGRARLDNLQNAGLRRPHALGVAGRFVRRPAAAGAGRFLIVDDYGALPNCRRAVEDFRTDQGITDPIVTVDWTGVYWRKGTGAGTGA